ncbi:MAG: NAD(P)H-binding protein [Phycisphaerales bacterium]|nr:NAD(P)H-binding protein [Phycisphaerales bacterium]
MLKVMIFGATGMLGRPVVRRLCADGRFAVHALVRDPERAAQLLPAGCALLPGDLRDADSVARACEGMHAVYCNLNTPYGRTRFNPDLHGTFTIVKAARRAGVQRIARLSALEVPDARHEWPVIQQKYESDLAVMEAGIAWTVFRPAWFFESLPLFIAGRKLQQIGNCPTPLYWIAGDDYARQVAAALASPRAENQIYNAQGPEPLTFAAALARFAAAYRPQLRLIRIPRLALRLGGLVLPAARYLDRLLTVTERHGGAFRAATSWEQLGRPTMSVEDYVAYIAHTGDLPRK